MRALRLPMVIVPLMVGGAFFSLAGDAPQKASDGTKATASTAVSARTAERKAKTYSADQLTRLLRAKQPGPRDAALREIAEFHTADAAQAEALWQAIQQNLRGKTVPLPVLEAIAVHGLVEAPEAVRHHVSLLANRDPHVVIVAAEGLGNRDTDKIVPDLIKLAERPEFSASYAFRHSVVSAVAKHRKPESVDFLVKSMEKFDGQLRFEIAMRLAQLTGQKFGGIPADWKAWSDENRSDFRFPDQAASSPAGSTPESPAAIPWTFNVPRFYGTPIYANRVVFVLDRSKSMMSSVDGVTRLREAQREFEETLRNLPESTWFNVVIYNDQTDVWQADLVQAVPQAKALALRFVNGIVPERKTATYDALAEALGEDQNLEAILFLSDGQPTAGSIVDRPSILREITKSNLFRRVAINTIGIDAEGEAREFLRALAAQNFGTFREIR